MIPKRSDKPKDHNDRAAAKLASSPIDSTSTGGGEDRELELTVGEEEQCLDRILKHAEQRRSTPSDRPLTASDYDAQLLALRDELSTARLEDVPPLLEQMERLQSLADQRRKEQAQGSLDVRSPYFGRMVLEESARRREVLIGRGTYLDTKAGIRIVDWRDAPVSRLYYRYQERDDYSEVFGGKVVEGEVITRRSLSIVESQLRRIGSPQGTFARMATGGWRRLDMASTQLRGGEGTATRPEQRPRGALGVGDSALSDDKSLREITALIDPRQFDLITRPDSGLVVIQGGAGSGKTTIGLHRLAYLAFNDKRRFRPDRMLVVVFNDALCRYIAQVLPSLGVEGVAIRTYGDWAARLRTTHLLGLPTEYAADTPGSVTRFKKHPAMLRWIDEYIEAIDQHFERELQSAAARAGQTAAAQRVVDEWRSSKSRPLRHRAHALLSLTREQAESLGTDLRVAVERIANAADARGKDVVSAWSELLTDRERIQAAFSRHAPGQFSANELARIHEWCSLHCGKVISELEARREGGFAAKEAESEPRPGRKERRASEPAPAWEEVPRDVERESEARRRNDSEDPDPLDANDDRSQGIDGASVEEAAVLDREDDTLLLSLHQRLRGPLLRGSKAREALIYEHVLVDEAQDYSPVELAVLLGTVSSGRSVTLAGDTAQRVLLDNGFSDWDTVLGELGLSHVEIEPLRISYRSTQEIIDLSHAVLGPIAPEHPGVAVRRGAPVELFRFAHSGDAAGFAAEQLRALMTNEPRACVAVIARFPEQADAFYDVLDKGEVPRLRRIADQDFPFKPGVDVTDVRQVKGLEFDYVVLIDVNVDAYPETEEARHLLHIGATRASHQLWILTTGEPSRLLPEDLRERAL
ncbi:MAG TPA: 3'-5' exonuclease [Polyangiaceae bacterium]|nr:3'-5' exonuclease [Polyangiaceae bacterium]